MALETLDSQDASIPYTAPKSTGLTEKIALDPTQTEQLLGNMQRFLDERESPLSKLVSGLQGATATARGPQAYAAYQQQKLAEDKQAMDYHTQMAAFKAAQTQAQNDATRLSGLLNTEPSGGASGTTTIPGVGPVSNAVINDPYVRAQLKTAKTADEALQIIAKANATAFNYSQRSQAEAAGNEEKPRWFSALNKNLPISSNQYRTYLQTGELPLNLDPNDRQAAKQLWLQEHRGAAVPSTQTQPTTAATPSAQTQPAAVPSAQTQPAAAPGSLPVSAIRTAESNNNPNVPPSAKGAVGPMQVLPSTARNPGFGVAPAKDNSPEEMERVGRDYYAAMQKRYGNDTIAAVAYNWGPGNTDKWLKAGGDPAQLPNETKQYVAKAHAAAKTTPQVNTTQTIPTGNSLTPNESVVQPTAAPTAASSSLIPTAAAATLPEQRAALKTTPKFSGPEEYKQYQELEQKQAESQIAINEAEKKRAAEGAADRYAEMKKNGDNAKKMILAADAIYNISSNPKAAEGLGMAKQGLNVNSILSNTIHALGAVGTLGHMSEKEANDWASKTLPPETQNYRDQLEKHAKDLGIGYAAQVFHGARMGIGLEKMAMESKGIGSEFSADTNKMHSDIIREGAKFSLAKKELWKQFVAEHGGDENKVSFNAFENDPRYINLEDQTHANLAKKYPQIFNSTDRERTDGVNLSHVSGSQGGEYKTTPSGVKYKVK